MNNTIHNSYYDNLVLDYQQFNDNEILEKLIKNFEPLLISLVKKHILKYKGLDFEDCLQNAKIATIEAIKQFDFSKENKLSTYIYFKVSKYLLTCNDEQNIIKCPTHMREVKSYLGGKYDTNLDKKQKFEQKHHIKNFQDFSKLKKENNLLVNGAIVSMPTELMPEQKSGTEEESISNLNNRIFVRSLSEEEQTIIGLLTEGHSQNQISKILKCSNAKQISAKVNTIRQKFVKYYYG